MARSTRPLQSHRWRVPQLAYFVTPPSCYLLDRKSIVLNYRLLTQCADSAHVEWSLPGAYGGIGAASLPLVEAPSSSARLFLRSWCPNASLCALDQRWWLRALASGSLCSIGLGADPSQRYNRFCTLCAIRSILIRH